jgi:hypothetical protein
LTVGGLALRAAVCVMPQGLYRTTVTGGTWPTGLHTMWMPRPCTWNDMNAASTPYVPVLARQAGRMSVSAARRGRR